MSKRPQTRGTAAKPSLLEKHKGSGEYILPSGGKGLSLHSSKYVPGERTGRQGRLAGKRLPNEYGWGPKAVVLPQKRLQGAKGDAGVLKGKGSRAGSSKGRSAKSRNNGPVKSKKEKIDSEEVRIVSKQEQKSGSVKGNSKSLGRPKVSNNSKRDISEEKKRASKVVAKKSASSHRIREPSSDYEQDTIKTAVVSKNKNGSNRRIQSHTFKRESVKEISVRSKSERQFSHKSERSSKVVNSEVNTFKKPSAGTKKSRGRKGSKRSKKQNKSRPKSTNTKKSNTSINVDSDTSENENKEKGNTQNSHKESISLHQSPSFPPLPPPLSHHIHYLPNYGLFHEDLSPHPHIISSITSTSPIGYKGRDTRGKGGKNGIEGLEEEECLVMFYCVNTKSSVSRLYKHYLSDEESEDVGQRYSRPFVDGEELHRLGDSMQTVVLLSAPVIKIYRNGLMHSDLTEKTRAISGREAIQFVPSTMIEGENTSERLPIILFKCYSREILIQGRFAEEKPSLDLVSCSPVRLVESVKITAFLALPSGEVVILAKTGEIIKLQSIKLSSSVHRSNALIDHPSLNLDPQILYQSAIIQPVGKPSDPKYFLIRQYNGRDKPVDLHLFDVRSLDKVCTLEKPNNTLYEVMEVIISSYDDNLYCLYGGRAGLFYSMVNLSDINIAPNTTSTSTTLAIALSQHPVNLPPLQALHSTGKGKLRARTLHNRIYLFDEFVHSAHSANPTPSSALGTDSKEHSSCTLI